MATDADAVGITARRWTLRHDARPPTANAYRRLHPHARADVDQEWRVAFAWLAKQAHVPHLERVAVTAMPVMASRRSTPDTAACFPAVKAAIDGLVDARVLDDDDPAHVLEIRFTAPAMGDRDALVLVVEELP